MLAILLRVSALTLAALSLGLSCAHALEAPPRLETWPAELWRETTVFQGQFALFGAVGGPVEALAVVLAAVAAVVAFRGRGAAVAASLAALLFAAALVVWLTIVQPANLAMATWGHGPLPGEFRSVQFRWEMGHAIMAALKLVGFMALATWAVQPANGKGGLSFH